MRNQLFKPWTILCFYEIRAQAEASLPKKASCGASRPHGSPTRAVSVLRTDGWPMGLRTCDPAQPQATHCSSQGRPVHSI